MISLVPSRIWCTRKSRTIFSMPYSDEIAVAAMQLQRLIGDVEAGVGDEALGHGAKLRGVRVVAVERRGGAPQQGARRFEPGRHVGEAELQRLEFVKALAEGLALFHVGERFFQRRLRAAERAGRDIEPAAVEPGHRDLEAKPFLAEPVGGRARARPGT